MTDGDQDQIKRENIPIIADEPKHRPVRNLLMVKMLPDVEQIGQIILPSNNSIKADACEGHVIDKGPLVKDEFEIGDCIIFEKTTCIGLTIDDRGEFYLVPANAIWLRFSQEDLKTAKAQRSSATTKRSNG